MMIPLRFESNDARLPIEKAQKSRPSMQFEIEKTKMENNRCKGQ